MAWHYVASTVAAEESPKDDTFCKETAEGNIALIPSPLDITRL